MVSISYRCYECKSKHNIKKIVLLLELVWVMFCDRLVALIRFFVILGECSSVA